MNGSKYSILCAILALVFLFTGCSAYRTPDDSQGNGAGNGMLDFGMVDGPGMERRWTEYALFSDWVEITNGSQWMPARLSFTPDRCTYSNEWTETSFGYTIPEDAVNISSPKGEVYIEIDDQSIFQGFIYHEEVLENGRWLPVLSGTAVELAGRGEIVLIEFVLETDIDELPKDFYSSAYISRNCTDGIPTYIKEQPALKEAPAEGDLITNETFYAKVLKNRYGGYAEEDAYAPDRFLLWVMPMEMSASGDFEEACSFAVPYIVSDEGNDENLSLLSGGVDGMDPYGEAILRLTTDKNGEIVDAVFIDDLKADGEIIDGNTIASHETTSPISSQDISSFHGKFSTMNYGGENDEPWLYIVSACLEDGVVKGSYQEYYMDYSPDAVEFEAAPSFLTTLQTLVVKYDLTQYNGYSKQVEGLPEFYGDALKISYQSGESMYAFNNQDNVLPYSAAMDIVKLFRSYAGLNS